MESASAILVRILVAALVIMTVGVLYFILKYRWKKADDETRQMLFFVDKIIGTLKKHDIAAKKNKDIPPYLPIPHVRDMLIPLMERKKMSNVWQKTVDFLNTSDSRIRVEAQQIAGEDFEVWRWIGVTPDSGQKSNEETKRNHFETNVEQEKCWQGPAFDQIEKVVRMPIVIPTPCLKVRYMHDGPEEKDKNWDIRVQDALLEKCCQDGAQVLHIYVDKTSTEGCVYAKFNSLDSAGKAFRSIYGNWFDGRLVVVKFVTLARYHQRFPDAVHSVDILRTSGKYASSLHWDESLVSVT